MALDVRADHEGRTVAREAFERAAERLRNQGAIASVQEDGRLIRLEVYADREAHAKYRRVFSRVREELARADCVPCVHDASYGRERPKRLDQLAGVIVKVSKKRVTVRLVEDKAKTEYVTQLDRELFSEGNVAVEVDTGFDFWVEQYEDGSEKPVVKAQDRQVLSKKDLASLEALADELEASVE